MKLEQKCMQDLLLSFTSHSQPEGLSGAKPDELQKRLGILHLGFEIRTRAVLEREFPRFYEALPFEKWIQLGKTFSRTEAPRVEQLGLLPHKFYVAMRKEDLSQYEISALEKDYLVFQSRHTQLKKPFLQTDLQTLTEDSLIQLQPTVFLQMQSSHAWVISRSRDSFFEVEVPMKTADLLLKLQENPLQLSEAMNVLSTDQELSQFLVHSIRNYWLQSPNRP